MRWNQTLPFGLDSALQRGLAVAFKHGRLPTLRARLLGWLLPSMAIVLAVSLWNTRSDAIEAANAAFDRSLLGAVKGLDLYVTTTSGGLAVEQPYRLFEFFQLTAAGPVFYRVATDDGLVEIGSPDLPMPTEPLQAGAAVFFDATYFGEPIRVGALKRVLDPPVGQASHVVIQVAETTASRVKFSASFVRQTVWRDALILGLLALVVTWVSAWALRPVRRLARATMRRAPEDLGPLRSEGLPEDLHPLVTAINQQLARTSALVEQRRQFLDDASHQLRTPLATLRAQVDYARREQDVARMREALDALSSELEHAARATNQLLLMARTDAGALHVESFDLAALAREVALALLPLARALPVDFGVDAPDEPLMAQGDRLQLREALMNLAHNGLIHGHEDPALGRGARSVVTVEVGRDGPGWFVGVVDNGPGMDADMAARAGTRFAKGRGSRGAGLGLAMASAVAKRHGGKVVLGGGGDGAGLRVSLHWGAS